MSIYDGSGSRCKWSVLVVMTLRGGSRRFSEIRRAIPGVSQRMLTLTLRGLERDGLVSRKVTPTILLWRSNRSSFNCS